MSVPEIWAKRKLTRLTLCGQCNKILFPWAQIWTTCVFPRQCVLFPHPPQEIQWVPSKLRGELLRRKLNKGGVHVGSVRNGRLSSWHQQLHWGRGVFSILPLLPRMKEHFVIKNQYVGPGNPPFSTRSGPKEGSSLLFSWARQPSVG